MAAAFQYAGEEVIFGLEEGVEVPEWLAAIRDDHEDEGEPEHEIEVEEELEVVGEMPIWVPNIIWDNFGHYSVMI